MFMISNLVKGDKADKLVTKFCQFRDIAEWQATKHHTDIKNTFAAAKLFCTTPLLVLLH